MKLYQKLIEIQKELKAPKGQTNKFGNYKYRSCEDILEALKPLLTKHEVALTISDEMKVVGDRYYVEATVTIESGEERTWVRASAREAEVKKGMDEAQITGSASSYARKYALNGMFAIDDTKDADSHDNTSYVPAPPKAVKSPVDILAKAKNELNKMLEEYGHSNTVKKKVVITMVLGKSSVDTVDDADQVMQHLTDGGTDSE